MTFLDCLAAGKEGIATDDIYNNPIVFKAMREKDLGLIYKAELDGCISDICIYIKLLDLLSSPVRHKIAEMIRSYLLYRRASNDIVNQLDHDLNTLYTAINADDEKLEYILEQTIHMARESITSDKVDPCAYNFLKRIADCKGKGMDMG